MRILPLGPREPLFKRAARRLARALHPPTSPLEFMEAVVIAERERRASDAARLCARGLERFPEDYYLLMKRIAQARDAGDRKTAVDLLPRAEAVCPATAATLASVGEEHAYLGEMEEAEALFRRALDRMPRSPDIREKLAMTLVQQRRMDEGIAELSVALDQEPGNTARRDLLANSLLHAERYQEAADLLTADPDEVLSWESLMCLSVARSRLQGGHEFADAIMNPLAPETPPQEAIAAPAAQESAG